LSETLFPYQVIGAEWLSQRQHALLADDMGLGKSAQAVTASDIVNAKRILILCPAVARVNWLREFSKFSLNERKFSLIESKVTKINETDSIICSYNLSQHLLDNFKEILGSFDLLILDECHFLKSVGTQRTHSVFGKEGLVRRAKRVWALSGTPAPNNPGDLWTLLFTFGATPLRYDDYVERFCYFYNSSHGRRITGTKLHKVPELRNVLSTVMLRRKKEDVMKDLPPIHFGHHIVERGPVDLMMEASFTRYVFPEDNSKKLLDILIKETELLESVVQKVGFTDDGLKTLGALAPSIATLRRYTGCQKVAAVAQMVKDEFKAKTYDKLVIFAIHRDVIEGLRDRLSDFGAVTLYGRTDPKRRQRNIDKFQKKAKCKVFIGNIMAAGTAITLTAAHHVIMVEQSWSPGDNAQAVLRCHRIGQTKPVLVRMIGLADSIDEHIMYHVKKKTNELAAIFDVDSQNIQGHHIPHFLKRHGLQNSKSTATNLEPNNLDEEDEGDIFS
jgi:SNF2 family DNA or RNA helicase